MPNLPNNQIVIDQSDRSAEYWQEDLETWETGAHLWRSTQKDNPSYFHAIPHKDGKFSTHEHQANGHYTSIVNSSKITQQDSASDGTTNNLQTQVGGGTRNVNGQGEHRERGGDDSKAVAGSTIALTKDSQTHISQQNGHHGVKGDYGFYVKGGGYSIGSEEQMVVTSQATIHMEAQSELSLKGIENMGMTTKGKMTLDSEGSMLANTASTFAANSASTMSFNTQSNMTHDSQGTHIITSASEIKLQVGDSYIRIIDGLIKMESGIIEVNHSQLTPTSNIFV